MDEMIGDTKGGKVRKLGFCTTVWANEDSWWGLKSHKCHGRRTSGSQIGVGEGKREKG